jgi:integrase
MPKPKRNATDNLFTDRKTGMWNVRWRIGGALRQRSLGTRNLKEAVALAKPILARVEAERHGHVAAERPRSRITWKLVEDNYRQDGDAWPVKENTRTRYDIELERIGLFLAEQDVLPAEVTPATVKEFVAFCRAEELSTSSVKHALTVFNCAMSSAVYADLLDGNPVKAYDRKRLRDTAPAMNPPLNGEFERMQPEVRRLMPQMAMFTEFLHRTGCRAGEALHAGAGDVFGGPGARQIWLHKRVKRDRPRTILLNSAEELLDRLPGSGRLFPDLPGNVQDVSSLWGRFWKRRRTEVERAAAAEGREPTDWERRRWRLHDLRGAFAINAAAAGANHMALMKHLGHSNFATTQIYLKAADRLPVALRGGLRLFWRGEKQSDVDLDGPQPEVTPADVAAMAAFEEEWRREQGVPTAPVRRPAAA